MILNITKIEARLLMEAAAVGVHNIGSRDKPLARSLLQRIQKELREIDAEINDRADGGDGR